MSYLALDTSGKRLTVLINHNNKDYLYTDPDCGVAHSVQVMVQIDALAKKANLNLAEVDFFACVTGAGSFTGIRIGVSTIKALCFAYQKPALAITSFDTIAYNKQEGKVLAVINAGHGGYYTCGYNDGQEVLPPQYLLTEQVLGYTDYELLAFEEISDFKVNVVDIPNGLKRAVEKKKNNLIDANELNPVYVRKSQAEEGRK